MVSRKLPYERATLREKSPRRPQRREAAPRGIWFALLEAGVNFKVSQTPHLKEGIDMVHRTTELSPEQRAAAELLLGRPLRQEECVSVQAFEAASVPEDRRREVLARLTALFAEVDRNLKPASPEEAEEVFTEAMRSSRPGYRSRR